MTAMPGGWFKASNAVVIGLPAIGDGTSIWFGCVVRCDVAPITIGACTNLQDGVIVHCDTGEPNTIGDHCTIGHRALLHGAEVGNRALIGMGAILLGRSKIGDEAIVAAGAVVKEGFVVPARTLVAGIPARVIREVTDAERDALLKSALRYRGLAQMWCDHDVVTPAMVKEHDEREQVGPFRARGR